MVLNLRPQTTFALNKHQAATNTLVCVEAHLSQHSLDVCDVHFLFYVRWDLSAVHPQAKAKEVNGSMDKACEILH